MDAKKIMAVVDEYKAGRMDFIEASFALVMLGCDGEEAIKILEQHTK